MDNGIVSKPRKRFWTKERYYQLAAIVLTLALCTAIVLYRHQIRQFEQYGYLGVFLISVISSSSIVIPVPGWFIIAAMGAVLNPFLVGVISALGGTLGEMTGYMLGYGGRIVIPDSQIYKRIATWMSRWGSLTIFVLALIPNPFFDFAGIASGLLRFPLWKFLLAGAAGRIPKHIMFAFLGMWGGHFIP